MGNEMGYRDWLTLKTQMMSAFLDLYSPCGAGASLNKLLLHDQPLLTSIYHSCVYPWEYWITVPGVPSSDQVFAACPC